MLTTLPADCCCLPWLQASQSEKCRIRVTVLNETASPDGEHKVGLMGGHAIGRGRGGWGSAAQEAWLASDVECCMQMPLLGVACNNCTHLLSHAP